MCTVVLRLGDLAQVAAPPWAAGQLGPGSGWRVTQRRYSRKALERPQGATPRGPLPKELSQIPTDRRPGSQAGSRGGQAEVRGSG